MDAEKLHQSKSYKYLAVVIDEGNNQETEINARIEKIDSKFQTNVPPTKRKTHTNGSLNNYIQHNS